MCIRDRLNTLKPIAFREEVSTYAISSSEQPINNVPTVSYPHLDVYKRQTFDLKLSESSTPETFRRRAASLTGIGLSESEARHVVATTPVPMELFCDSERGIFAVEAEPLA